MIHDIKEHYLFFVDFKDQSPFLIVAGHAISNPSELHENESREVATDRIPCGDAG